jgi:phosphoglycolate phosphatase
MRYRLLLFDFDGTLADTLPAVTATVQATFRGFELPAPEAQEVLDKVGLGLSLEATFATLIGGDESKAKTMAEYYRGIYAENDAAMSRLYEGIPQVLTAVKDSGAAMAVVSNRAHHVLEGCLARRGLGGVFDLFAGALPSQPAKPDPAVFHERVAPGFPEVPAQEMLMIGDTTVDMDFAANIGCDACYAAWGYGEGGEEKGRHKIAARPDELHAVIFA